MAMDTPEKTFPPFPDEARILEIVQGFRDRTLPQPQWTHQAHLAVGLWHVLTLGEGEAANALRTGIRRYNEAVGTPNNDQRGYHETVTMFYVWAAARHIERHPGQSLLDLVNGFVEGELGAKSAPFAYWSREGLLSVAARHTWVEPDLQPLNPPAMVAPATSVAS